MKITKFFYTHVDIFWGVTFALLRFIVMIRLFTQVLKSHLVEKYNLKFVLGSNFSHRFGLIWLNIAKRQISAVKETNFGDIDHCTLDWQLHFDKQ